MSNIGQIFPNLEQLVIIANPIASLGPKEKAGENLAKLKAINLQETQIKSWEEVEKLRGIPALTDIRLRRTPVLQVLIAVICNIRTPGIWDGPLFIRGGGHFLCSAHSYVSIGIAVFSNGGVNGIYPSTNIVSWHISALRASSDDMWWMKENTVHVERYACVVTSQWCLYEHHQRKTINKHHLGDGKPFIDLTPSTWPS